MTVTVELSSAVVQRLRAEAARQGVQLDDLIAQLADALPVKQEAVGRGHHLAFIAAGASAEGTTPYLDDLLADGLGRD